MRSELQTLKRIYAQQLTYVKKNPGVGVPSEDAVEGFPFMAYLDHKFSLDIIIEREIRIVEMVLPWVRGRVLDWGCHHGHAACIIRMRVGRAVELFGCDVFNETAYQPFHEYSGMIYSRVKHAYRLDYDDASFDVVLSNGVLEHVPNELASIREIRRILKPEGSLVVTALPNKYSYTEAVGRLRGMGHERLYTPASMRRTLSEEGFTVIASKHFFVLPTMLSGCPRRVQQVYNRARGMVRTCNVILEKLWPLNRISSNLMIVAKKA